MFKCLEIVKICLRLIKLKTVQEQRKTKKLQYLYPQFYVGIGKTNNIVVLIHFILLFLKQKKKENNVTSPDSLSSTVFKLKSH